MHSQRVPKYKFRDRGTWFHVRSCCQSKHQNYLLKFKNCLLGKATRMGGFAKMRALSSALQSVGLPLQAFSKPKSVLLDPFSSSQRRCWRDGAFWVFDEKTQEAARQLPENFDLSQTPILVWVSDQGPWICPCVHVMF